MDGPTNLSRQAIDELKTAYLEEFGESISDQEAKDIALRLLRFLELLQPIQTEVST